MTRLHHTDKQNTNKQSPWTIEEMTIAQINFHTIAEINKAQMKKAPIPSQTINLAINEC